MACLAAKPVVDGLEDDLGDRAVFLRANLSSAVGEELGARYDVTGVPTILAFDRRGKLVLQHTGARLPVARLRHILSATGE